MSDMTDDEIEYLDSFFMFKADAERLMSQIAETSLHEFAKVAEHLSPSDREAVEKSIALEHRRLSVAEEMASLDRMRQEIRFRRGVGPRPQRETQHEMLDPSGVAAVEAHKAAVEAALKARTTQSGRAVPRKVKKVVPWKVKNVVPRKIKKVKRADVDLRPAATPAVTLADLQKKARV